MKTVIVFLSLLFSAVASAHICTVVIRDEYRIDRDSFTRTSYSTTAACGEAMLDCQQKLSDYQSYGRYYDAVCAIRDVSEPYPIPYPPTYPTPYPPSYPPAPPSRWPEYPRYPSEPQYPRYPREPQYPRYPREPQYPRYPREPGREPPRHEPGSGPRRPWPR